ncbi:hypothetical protein M0R45_009545 [Rubus argutus]|uniref:RNase H type-1 domain-containing protein n=1 Tax=Rubus argutus TaxID=59490 RepID=A0AAW1Y4Y2_RUBAR
MSGRMTKWAIELSEFDIEYQPRTSLRGQVVADFLVECHFPIENNHKSSSGTEAATEECAPCWIMHIDGASNMYGAGIGIILKDTEGLIVECAARLDFPASNNMAEYEALLVGMRIAKKLRV